MKTYFFTILALLIFSISAYAQNQTRVIYGEVTTLNDLPVANFEVRAKKSGASALTDSTGVFRIVTQPRDVLLFKGKVFRNERMRIKEKTADSVSVHVEYIESEKNRERAIGYGYVSREDLLNSVSSFDRQQADFCSYDNIFDLIKGRFAGVQVRGEEIIIRGISSINLSNAALLVVDGNIVQSISYINPCDVESIDVIKDSAAAIYGSRGSNGVVVIETRRGGSD